ncbi:MAG TPA: NAD(P)/FAD-dependent oxidoreductase [Rhizomicrobium sp.]|nr:NAD(P)/FAD-dependent oxidoreductase [Rhizomicrobium sp.]
MASATDHYDVVVIGAGFAGMYAVYKFRELGFRVLGFEKGDDVGGVWYWNRYPGARCDCESYYYSYSFSKELQDEWDWSLHYSEQPEILSYLSHVADRFELRRHIRFGTAVSAATFDEAAGLWSVKTSRNDTVTARFIVSAAGCLSEIQEPAIPGLKSFAGNVYYTAAWPKDGVDFTWRRVGVIGTGASGVQAIPRIARQAEQLTVFQRTANWVIPVWNAPMKAEFVDWVKSNYDRIRQNCLSSGGGVPFEVSHTRARDVTPEERQKILEAAWTVGGTRFFAQSFADLLSDQEANDAAAQFVARYIRSIVKDPAVARLLTPTDHPIGTKRPPMDDDYYATFNRPNVTLVDIRHAPIAGIAGHTLRTTEGSYELDDLVLATGFDAITGPLLAIDIRGRGGVRLKDKWKSGAKSYLCLCAAGFPNLFMVTGPLSPSVLANMPTAIEQHVDWIGDCLVHLRSHNVQTIEARDDAEETWVTHTADVAQGTLYPKANSWSLGSNIPGKPRQFGVYLGGFSNYRARCNDVAAHGYEGFRLEPAA